MASSPAASDAILRLLLAITGSRVSSSAKQGRRHTTLGRKATGEEKREAGGRKKRELSQWKEVKSEVL